MSVTQKEIAEKLNVSQSQVARALGSANGNSRVSTETRRRVKAVAQEMGYDRYSNREARTMAGRRHARRSRTNIIAIALPLPAEIAPRRIPYYHAFFDGVELEAAAMSYDVCIIHRRFGKIPRLLRSYELDGAIVAGFSQDEIPVIRSSGLAVVTYQSSFPGVPSVRSDHHSGVYQATRHLLELGHRKIAFVGVLPDAENFEFVALRLNGYRDALIEAGVPVRDEWIETSLQMPNSSGNDYCVGCDHCAACVGWSTLKARAGVASSQRPPFTAVVCHNDPIGMGVIRQAEKTGLSVPRDLSVTGFDNLSTFYDFHPQITSVGCSHQEMGQSAMRLLGKAIDEMVDASGKNEASNENQVFSVQLTVGESTATPGKIAFEK